MGFCDGENDFDVRNGSSNLLVNSSGILYYEVYYCISRPEYEDVDVNRNHE